MVRTTLSDWLKHGEGGVAITGASGWIGGSMVHVALEAGASRLRLFGSETRTIEIAGRPLAIEPLKNAAPLGDGEWLVVHAAVAGLAREADPERQRALNDGILADILDLASETQVRRLVHASSGAVHRPPDHGSDHWRRYGLMKRDHEAVVRAWSRKTGAPILLPRIFNVGGPYITHASNYALGDFIQQARAKGSIAMTARRPVLRSYVHVLELARVTFGLALDDGAPEAFDTGGPETVELGDLARAVGRALGLADLRIDRPAPETDEPDRYVGDNRVFQDTLARLGDRPASLEQIILDTAAWIPA